MSSIICFNVESVLKPSDLVFFHLFLVIFFALLNNFFLIFALLDLFIVLLILITFLSISLRSFCFCFLIVALSLLLLLLLFFFFAAF